MCPVGKSRTKTGEINPLEELQKILGKEVWESLESISLGSTRDCWVKTDFIFGEVHLENLGPFGILGCPMQGWELNSL